MHNINQENSLETLTKTNFSESYVITKTQSASNVFYGPLNGNARNSANSALTVQYTKNSSDFIDNSASAQFRNNHNFDLNQNNEVKTANRSFQNVAFKTRYSDKTVGTKGVSGPKPFDKTLLRRGSSVENVNSSILDLTSNGTLKKIKYGNEVGYNVKSYFKSINRIVFRMMAASERDH